MTQKFTSILLLMAILLSSTACADSNETPTTDQVQNADTTTGTDTEPSYNYPELDCGGEDFTILNGYNTWGFYESIDFDTLSGESLDDAVYNRNRKVEDRYKFKLVTEEELNDKLANKIRTSVSAGDNEFEAVYCPANFSAALISDGIFQNLYDIPELSLESDWWNQAVVNEASIGTGSSKALYYAASDLQLFGFDGTWCVFFNENMLEDHKLEKPYDLVRDGKWTLDRMIAYAKDAGNLNGDDSFTFSTGGNATYGMTSSYAFPVALIIGSGERFIKKDDKGEPYFALETEKFYNLADKIAAFASSEGDYVSRNNNEAEGDHYEMIFKAKRAIFLGAELKACSKLRDFDDQFGIVPIPKFDESQENYYSSMSKATVMLAVPVTNPDTKKAGVILDTLSYESTKDVLPVYYDIRISQKGLRNEDSIEMLDIIRDTRYCDVGDAYGWTTKLQDRVRRTLDSGSADIASIIAEEKPTVVESIKKTLEALK